VAKEVQPAPAALQPPCRHINVCTATAALNAGLQAFAQLTPSRRLRMRSWRSRCRRSSCVAGRAGVDEGDVVIASGLGVASNKVPGAALAAP